MIKSFEELERMTRERISHKSVPKMGIVFPGGGKSIQAAAHPILIMIALLPHYSILTVSGDLRIRPRGTWQEPG